jgi:hypothetical protein
MADDERDGPGRPPSRGPRVVTGGTGGTRAATRKTATGWAPTAPADAAPADAAPADAADAAPADADQSDPGPDAAAAPAAEAADAEAEAAHADPGSDESGGDDLTEETLVGPGVRSPLDDPTVESAAARPGPSPAAAYQPRRPRVVTGATPPVPAEPESPPTSRVVTGATRPAPPGAEPGAVPRQPPAGTTRADFSRPPVWAETEPEPAAAAGPVTPPPVHRAGAAGGGPPAGGSPTAAPPAPRGKAQKAPKPPKPPKTAKEPGRGGGPREPLALRSFALAVVSLVTAGILAIPALLLARRARRRIAAHPGATGRGLVKAAVVVSVLSLAAWLAIAGVVVAKTVRPEGVDYATLKPGDCFDTPDGTEVRRLTIRTCDKPHDAEVFALVTHPAAATDPFPGADALLAYAANACLGQPFTDYVGIPRGQSQLTEFEIVPESEAWSEGRRGLVCAVDTADRSPLTTPVKGSAR